MNPKQAINRLVAAGYTHAAIARMLSDKGVPIKQPTVYRIGSGEIQNTSFETGKAIVDLCESLAPDKPPRRKKAA